MRSIGARCYELRVSDPELRVTWRIIYRLDADAIIIGDLFAKKTQKTPMKVIDTCQRRFRKYDAAVRGG